MSTIIRPASLSSFFFFHLHFFPTPMAAEEYASTIVPRLLGSAFVERLRPRSVPSYFRRALYDPPGPLGKFFARRDLFSPFPRCCRTTKGAVPHVSHLLTFLITVSSFSSHRCFFWLLGTNCVVPVFFGFVPPAEAVIPH